MKDKKSKSDPNALEKKHVLEVIDSNELFYAKGKKTDKLVKTIKKFFKMPYAATMSSGTAAIHCAMGALEIPPGSEFITSPITDMGSLIGGLYQNLVPVFADVDPHSYNMDPKSIEEKITDKTKAIIVVHLAGNPCEMDEILSIAKKHNLKIVEDCAQSYGAKYHGKYIGTMGDIGCYSLNAFKHINCGDGGFIITNNEDLYYKAHNFGDKYYDRHNKGVRLSQLAPNYRITELQSAYALGQFKKLPEIIEKRNEFGNRFNKGVEALNLPITTHKVYPENTCSYWFTMLRLAEECPINRKEFVYALNYEKVHAGEGYIPHPIYLEKVFTGKAFFPGGIWPAEVISGKSYEYKEGLCPIAERVLKTAIRIPITQDMSIERIDSMVQGVKQAYENLLEE